MASKTKEVRSGGEPQWAQSAVSSSWSLGSLMKVSSARRRVQSAQ